MSDNQVINRQWNILKKAACSGSWDEFSKAELQLSSVDRASKIDQNKILAVKVIALVRSGKTDEATSLCVKVHKESAAYVDDFIIPMLKQVPESSCKDFREFAQSLIKTSSRKAMMHNLRKNSTETLANTFRINALFSQRPVVITSLVIGIALIFTAVWIRTEVSNSTPADFFNNISEGAEKRDPSIVWNSFPISFKSEFDSYIQLSARTLPESYHVLYDSQWNTYSSVINLLNNQRDFVLNSDIVIGALASLSKKDKELVYILYDNVVTALQSLSRSQLSSIDGLKRFNTSYFLENNGHTLLEAFLNILTLIAIYEEDADIMLRQYNSLIYLDAITTEEYGDYATVELKGLIPNFYGIEPLIPMTKIDNKWIPVIMAIALKTGMLNVNQALAQSAYMDFNLSPLQGLLAGASTTLINSLITPLKEADSQKEFNDAIAEIILKFNSPDFSRGFFP